MRRFVTFGLSLAVSGVFAGSVMAQNLSANAVPKELPPSSFSGRQYVDSAGCVFIRAGVSGVTNWVPRVSRDRNVICGQKPTFAGRSAPVEAPVAVAAAAAPVQKPAPVAAPTRVVRQQTVVRSAPAVQPVRQAVTQKQAFTYVTPPTPTAGTVVNLGGNCANASAASQAYINATGVRCGPQDWKPGQAGRIGQASGTTAAPAQVYAQATASTVPRVQRQYLFSRATTGDVVANDRVHQVAPSGYRNVWTDGRLNPYRGIPGQEAYRANTATAKVQDNSWYPPRPTVSTRSAVPTRRAVVQAPTTTRVVATSNVGAGHRWVQVGSFTNAANAQRTARRFQNMGLSVRIGKASSYQVVLIGPYSNGSSLQSALNSARRAGFGDAYTRR
ncbi:MAG: SPOR domain-containing protein [Planktomarina sp.]